MPARPRYFCADHVGGGAKASLPVARFGITLDGDVQALVSRLPRPADPQTTSSGQGFFTFSSSGPVQTQSCRPCLHHQRRDVRSAHSLRT